jgi:hypothetical protein
MNSEALLMMNTGARQGLHAGGAAQAALKDSSKGSGKYITTDTLKSGDKSQSLRKIRVGVDSGNRAWWHEGSISCCSRRVKPNCCGTASNNRLGIVQTCHTQGFLL